ncbi:MAG: uroporphyrinogen-III synthase [Burkholderiaceae bacterium]
MSATLLLTRPRPQAADWLARLQALGVAARSLPLIEIVPGQGAQAAAAWAALPAAALAMFVSPNAVTQFFAARPPGPVWPAQTLAACVGPGSARALLDAGVPAALIVQPPPDSPSLDSEHLWPMLSARDWRGRQVLLLRGEGGRDWLAERLREQGALTTAFSIYGRRCPQLDAGQQLLLDQALARPQQHIWLFSSAEAIGHLRTLAPPGQDWRGLRAIATHARIAERARGLPGVAAGHVVLTRPDAAAVAAAALAMQGSDLQSFSP